MIQVEVYMPRGPWWRRFWQTRLVWCVYSKGWACSMSRWWRRADKHAQRVRQGRK